MAEDLIDQSALDDGSTPRDVTEIMRFAELYPAVPLRTLIAEIRHADTAVPPGADDRAEIITRLVASRLGIATPS